MLFSQPSFPLPFPSVRTVAGPGEAPYIIGALFTADYAEKAARLASSCGKFNLPYEFHEVPTVHRSMGIKGSNDLRFTKANFIHHLMRMHDKPVLYLDADTEFVAQPTMISELVRSRCDFAIYNWLADEYTDYFVPVKFGANGALEKPSLEKPYRYFGFYGGVDLYSTTQLIGVGWTQFYGNSFAARALLSRWHRTVAEFVGCADDDCLDFTYNNLSRRDWLIWALRRQWLPKEYSRGMFWIYAKPVINHPDIPAPSSRFPPIRCARGRKRFYRSLTEKRNVPRLFPRDCIIDAEEGMLCKPIDGKLVPLEKTPHLLWI